MANVVLTWMEVTADRSGNELDIDGYNVYEVDVTLPVGDPDRLTQVYPTIGEPVDGVVEATLTNVSEGSYTYEVRAVESNVESEGRVVSISVDGVPSAVTGLAAEVQYD